MQTISRVSIQILMGLFCIIHSATVKSADEPSVKISELNWMDRSYLSKQKAAIDELGRSNFGTPVRGNITDLQLLQRIINKGLISHSDSQTLQALGAVMGDIFISEHELSWRVYEDDLGRSRAVCVEDSEYCLFPITMLSRRMEVGIIPDVKQIYSKAVDIIHPHLPAKPFAVN